MSWRKRFRVDVDTIMGRVDTDITRLIHARNMNNPPALNQTRKGNLARVGVDGIRRDRNGAQRFIQSIVITLQMGRGMQGDFHLIRLFPFVRIRVGARGKSWRNHRGCFERKGFGDR